jgi:hypothetical protein
VPVAGDWDGNGGTDVGVVRGGPGTSATRRRAARRRRPFAYDVTSGRVTLDAVALPRIISELRARGDGFITFDAFG